MRIFSECLRLIINVYFMLNVELVDSCKVLNQDFYDFSNDDFFDNEIHWIFFECSSNPNSSNYHHVMLGMEKEEIVDMLYSKYCPKRFPHFTYFRGRMFTRTSNQFHNNPVPIHLQKRMNKPPESN